VGQPMLKKIFVSIFISIIILLGSLGLISYRRVQESIKKSYEERLSAAEMVASHIDHLLENNLARLYDISLSGKIDFTDGNWKPEQEALRDAYKYSIFTDGIFLLDRYGSVVQMYPYRDSGMINLVNIPAIGKAMSELKPVISNVYTLEPINKKVMFVIVPLKNGSGDIIGFAGGEINPANRRLAQSITYAPFKTKIDFELVDNQGFIIASNNNVRVSTPIDHNKFYANHIMEKKSYIGTCHRCHGEENKPDSKTQDIIVLAPLFNAPWGVSIREPQESVLTPATQLKKDFLIIAFISIATAFLLALGMSRRIVRPIKALIRAAQRIGKGNLSEPVEIQSKDEIGTLARSFDETRVQLAASLGSIQRYNMDLENRVYERTKQLYERTKQLEEKQLAIKTLLKQVITSQEDERKRIARELHDESLQSLSAILMDVGVCKLRPDLITTTEIAGIYDNITHIINEMNHLVQNLRPTVLDDLGFEAAIVWILDRNFRDRGIKCRLNMRDLSERQFMSEFQITVFRIVQEMSTNIARHANAQNVFVNMKDSDDEFTMSMEDDGVGFDTASVLRDSMSRRGLGILGMKERAALLKGRLTICSAPQAGTMVLLRIPLSEV
jgi:signal transduction histidine kinase